MDKVKIVYGERDHTFSIDKEITESEAIEMQIQAGYHPAGYGFYKFKSENGISTWMCGSSCD